MDQESNPSRLKRSNRNRRSVNDDGTDPLCLVCGKPALKHNRRKKWHDTCGSSECHLKLRTERMIATKKTRDNRISALKGALKQRNTVADGTSQAEITARKIKSTMSKIGSDGLTGYQRAARKAVPRIREANTAGGHWIPDHLRNDFDLYCRQVARAQSVFAEEIKRLPNFDKRSTADADGWHLDHRISKYEGFKLGIPPEKIGHICNLQMKHWLDNNRKWSRSDLGIDDLNRLIERYSQ